MGGPNLEVFKFGMYIMFPIGWMYYFGTNLDSRFSTPDFWPKREETHTIPFEKEEIAAELERLKARRLAARARRLELEAQGESTDIMTNRDQQAVNSRPEILEATTIKQPEEASSSGQSSGWLSWLK